MREEDAQKLDELLGVDPDEELEIENFPKPIKIIKKNETVESGPVTNDASKEKSAENGISKETLPEEKIGEGELLVDVSSELSSLEGEKAVPEQQDRKNEAFSRIEKILQKRNDIEEKVNEEIAERNAPSISKLSPEQQIDKLVELAKNRGVEAAIRTAQKLDNNYILDQAHGRLTEDELYEELIKLGIIKSAA